MRHSDYQLVVDGFKDIKLPKLSKEIAKIWLEALRSGDYVQGQDVLAYIPQGDTICQYCCLGVLAKQLISEETPLTKLEKDGYFTDLTLENFRQNIDIKEVREFLLKKVESEDILSSYKPNVLSMESLFIRFNDDLGMTFHQIADFIEEFCVE